MARFSLHYQLLTSIAALVAAVLLCMNVSAQLSQQAYKSKSQAERLALLKRANHSHSDSAELLLRWESALVAAPQATIRHKAHYYQQLSHALTRGENVDTAIAALAHSTALFAQIQDSNLFARNNIQLAALLQENGQLEEATSLLLASQHYYQYHHHDSGLTAVKEQMVINDLQQGHPHRAVETLQQCLSYKVEARDTAGLVKTYLRLGSVYAQLGELNAAASSFQQAVDFGQTQPLHGNLAAAYGNLATVNSVLEQFDKAEQLHHRSIELRQKLNDQKGLAEAYNNLGDLYYNTERWQAALSSFEQSAAISKQLGLSKVLVVAIENQAITHEVLGNYQAAFNLMWMCDSIRQTLSREQYSQEVARLQEQFEAEKKDHHIRDLQKDNQLQVLALASERNQRNAWIAGSCSLALGLLVLGISILQHRRKNRQLALKNAEIERQRAEAIATSNQLRETTATTNRIYSIIAHNLRGPVASLDGIAPVLQRYIDRGEHDKLQKVVTEIGTTAYQTNALVENLLYWARAKTQAIPYRPQELELQGLLQQTAELLAMQAERKHISVELNNAPPQQVWADLSIVKTIMTNLLHNAIKFTPENGSVRIATRQENQRIYISVSDSGIGIPPKRLAMLFEENSTKSTHGTRGERGTGLGLLVCREFAQLAGGELTVKSQPGHGTTFTFSLAPGSHPSATSNYG